jgi:hypothetical protein
MDAQLSVNRCAKTPKPGLEVGRLLYNHTHSVTHSMWPNGRPKRRHCDAFSSRERVHVNRPPIVRLTAPVQDHPRFAAVHRWRFLTGSLRLRVGSYGFTCERFTGAGFMPKTCQLRNREIFATIANHRRLVTFPAKPCLDERQNLAISRATVALNSSRTVVSSGTHDVDHPTNQRASR